MLWRQLTPQRKLQYKTAQLHSLLYTTAKKHYGKFTSYVTFDAHKLVHYEPFLDPQCEIWQLLLALYSEMQKKILAVCCGAIWRRREKLQYRCTTTIPHMHKTPKMFWKIYFLYDFWCTQTCSFWADFWTTYTNFDTCCQRYIATCKKNFYIGAHLHSWY